MKMITKVENWSNIKPKPEAPLYAILHDDGAITVEDTIGAENNITHIVYNKAIANLLVRLADQNCIVRYDSDLHSFTIQIPPTD